METNPRNELSSLASSLGTITEQLTSLAERCSTGGYHDLAREMFEVERTLVTSVRRLDKAASNKNLH